MARIAHLPCNSVSSCSGGLTRFKPHEIMAAMINTVADLIHALGGTTATARLCGVRPSAVSNWKKAGQLPARLFLPVMELCQARSLAVNRALFGPDLTASSGMEPTPNSQDAVSRSSGDKGQKSPLARVKPSARPDSQPKAATRRRRAA
jgi:hypothetical protein